MLLNKFQSASEGRLYGPAGRHRHHDHDPGGDPRRADPEAPGEGLQLRHHPQVERLASEGQDVARIPIKDLVKTFGAYTAVNGISLDISDGEFMILVGPSGCGKTTTLNMISGPGDADRRQIVIGNTVVNDLEPGERGLGMVFQELALFPHMTVFENIAFGLRVKKVAGREIARARDRGRGERCTSTTLLTAAAPLLRRREPARRARPHHRHQPVGVPDGRAAVEPRRQAAGATCAPSSRRCTSASAPPSSTSRTTRPRP